MFNKYQMHWEGKLKLRSHNISYCLIEVVTSAGLPKLDLYSAVLFHGYNSPQVDMSLYYYILYWSLDFTGEAANTNLIVKKFHNVTGTQSSVKWHIGTVRGIRQAFQGF